MVAEHSEGWFLPLRCEVASILLADNSDRVVVPCLGRRLQTEPIGVLPKRGKVVGPGRGIVRARAKDGTLPPAPGHKHPPFLPEAYSGLPPSRHDFPSLADPII